MIQVLMVGIFIAILAYVVIQLMTKNDSNALRIIRRNDNLSNATDLGDYVNNVGTIGSGATVLTTDPLGNPVLYH